METFEYAFLKSIDASEEEAASLPAKAWAKLPPLATKAMACDSSWVPLSPRGGMPLKYIRRKEMSNGWHLLEHKAGKRAPVIVRPLCCRAVSLRTWIPTDAAAQDQKCAVAWLVTALDLAGNEVARVQVPAKITVGVLLEHLKRRMVAGGLMRPYQELKAAELPAERRLGRTQAARWLL